jgi:hypothetical protein
VTGRFAEAVAAFIVAAGTHRACSAFWPALELSHRAHSSTGLECDVCRHPVACCKLGAGEGGGRAIPLLARDPVVIPVWLVLYGRVLRRGRTC